MSVVKIVERNNMIEEAISTKENAKLGSKKNNNDLNQRKTKSSDYKRSISLQTSKKKDQKGSNYQLEIALFTYKS